MAQGQTQAPNMDQFELYFRTADADQDGRISGNEAVSFFQATNLPRPVLAQIWTIADQNGTGYLGRQEFYNALKLVTVAQSKRQLTPEIVRAALFGPASAQIPPPRIDLKPTPGPPSNIAVGSSVPLQAATPAPQTIGFTPQQNQVMRPPRPPIPTPTFQSPQVVNGPGMPQYGDSNVVSQPPNSSAWVGGNNFVPQTGRTPSGLPTSTQPGAQATSGYVQPGQPGPSVASLGNKLETEDSKALTVAGNGHVSDSLFGDVFSVTPAQAKPATSNIPSGVTSSSVPSAVVPTSVGAQPTVKSSPLESSLQVTAVTSSSVPSADVPTSAGAQPTVKSSPLESSLRVTAPHRPMGNQHQLGQIPAKPNNQVTAQTTQGPRSVPANSSSAQSQVAWPRMTQYDIQRYSKVFMQVATDRDGKITGNQARNLFLSWGQPIEVLKQVWDLSDQDKDSKLSLKEFCIALYLMERYREGRPLPSELPSSIMFDEPLSASIPPVAPQTRAVQPGAFPGKPPRPVPVPLPDDGMQSTRQQKPKVPVLEKHLLDQLRSEEQNSLNSKFQEASDAEKKVTELEKEILDAREKIQFYHSKMTELVFYKSRCDSRLNEITERVSADKREVESLGKKYEEKYRQAGDVASKLTIEEATFRDIQDKKMELYRAILKLEQDGGGDGIEERVNSIQSELEELVKALNERCKTYGLRAKPTSLVELPFGWQPGVQEAAADWDGEWDLFEDEGFVTVKELTLDVQNVIAPPKPKSTLKDIEFSRDEKAVAKPLFEANDKSENVQIKSENENDRVNTQGEETASSLSESPVRNNALESQYKEFEDRFKKDISFDGSPHANHSEAGGYKSTFDRGFDEPGWGAFDSQYDTDGALDFNHVKKDMDSERQNENSSFGFDDWGLNPIRTGPPRTENIYQKQGPFFDSVPSTPSYNTGNSPVGENIFQRNSTFFADSVPSTPMYSSNNSPRRFGEGTEERSFDSFSRFDSFSMQDGGLFTPREPMAFSKFDSMRSSRDSEYDNGFSATHDSLARFDSFRSTADSDYNFGLFPPRERTMARFDSTVSNRDSDFGLRFSSFDDVDPFGSNDPFKTSLESETPRSHVDWNDHFKVSFDSQTPRRDSDTWNDPFKTSFDSQTPRRDSGSWSAF